MFIWLGVVRRVGMYWEGGRREITPLYHICYIKFISSLKKFYPINLIKMTKIENKNFKIKRKVLFTIKILFYRTLHLFPSWDDSKRARGGR